MENITKQIFAPVEPMECGLIPLDVLANANEWASALTQSVLVNLCASDAGV